MANKLIDLTGQRFGRLVVIGRDKYNMDYRGQPKWLFVEVTGRGIE